MFSYENNNSLKNWLIKLKENQVNSDMLLLLFKRSFGYNSYSGINFNNIKDKITKELAEKDIVNYKILKIDNIPSSKLDTNIILIGYEGMDRKFLQNIADVQILVYYCIDCKRKSILYAIIEGAEWDRYILLCIIKKREPVEILYSYNKYNKSQIVNYLLSYSVQIQFQNNIIIFSPSILKLWLTKDIEILNEEKVLTARLAKKFYMVSTLNFNASDVESGLYYKNLFGIKSKTKRLKEYGSKPYKVYYISEWLESKVQLTSDK